MTDRHRHRRLPQIPLADLARPIDRPLMRAQLHEHRADLAQVVIHDRLAAIEPQRLDLLPHPHPREPRVVLQQPVDLVLERIQLRRPHRHPEHRRLSRPQRRPDRVPRQPGPAHQLLDRQRRARNAPGEVRPSAPRPARLPPGLDQQDRARLNDHPGRLRPHPQVGSNLNRRRGVSLSPAPTAWGRLVV